MNPAVPTSEAHSLYIMPPTKAKEQTLNQQVPTSKGGTHGIATWALSTASKNHESTHFHDVRVWRILALFS